jgi:hypothetical protein
MKNRPLAIDNQQIARPLTPHKLLKIKGLRGMFLKMSWSEAFFVGGKRKSEPF